MNVKNDIEKTVYLLNNYSDNFTSYSKIYKFTTENIKEYFKYFNFNNKSILTVCSSGDHAINAYIKGCNNIDLFDINKITEYYLNYKIAAIKSLSYKQFFNGNFIYTKDLYTIIRNSLNHDTKFYWDNLYKYHYDQINSSMFFMSESNPEYNYYYDYKTFDSLKNNINEFNYNEFYGTNIINIMKYTNKKYDYILLSNISNYIAYSYPKETYKLYNNLIINKMSQLLNDDGLIVLAYLYDYSKNKLPKNYKHNYEMLDSGNDKILIYKKK